MPYLPIIGIFLLWELLAGSGIISKVLFPPPSQVLRATSELFSQGLPPGHGLLFHILYSLLRVTAGFSLALSVSLHLGFLAGWSPVANRLASPVINIIRPIPPLAWIPIAIGWLGIGIKSAAFLIGLGVFFPVFLNTVSGIQQVNPVYLDAARTLGARKFHLIVKVLIPAALPTILTGVRIGLGIGWMTLVAAELTGVRSGYGLGFLIMTARDLQRVDAIIAGMAIIGLVGYLAEAILASDTPLIAFWLSLYFGHVSQTYWMLHRLGNFKLYTALLFPVPLVFFAAVFFYSVVIVLFRRRVKWKGRSIELASRYHSSDHQSISNGDNPA